MVIEQIFITVLPAEEALTRASAFLSAREFVAVPQTTFPVNQPQLSAIEMRRGKKNPNRAGNINQLPQIVRVEWDRGRVTVAASIASNAAWGGRSRYSTASETPKKMRLHLQLLNTISLGLENLLAYDHTGTADHTLWDLAEAANKLAARKRKIRLFILFGIIVAFIAFVIILAVMSSR